jgi:hypothetical protein
VDGLRLENHCRRRLEPGRHPWAVGAGFVHAAWIDDGGEVLEVAPRPGERQRLHVGAPFEARPGEPFHVLWEPAIVARDGWEPAYQARLAEVRVVTCRYVEALATCVRGIGRSPSEGVDLRVDVLACRDPMAIAAREDAPEAGASAWPFGERGPQSLSIWRAPNRVLIAGSVEGDVDVALLVDPDVERLAMLVDTSLCEDFFWFGSARVGQDLRAMLARLL